MATAPDLLGLLPEISVRAMTEADLSSVAGIERESYPFPWSEGIFRDCVRVGYVCRVIELGTQLVGYGVMSVGAGEAHVLNVCVKADFRERGVGRVLLRHLLERAVASGITDAFLEVRPTNTAAIRLYQSLGFEPVGVRRGYYQAHGGREDANVLRLDLRLLQLRRS